MNRNHWVFNQLGMGTPKPFDPGPNDILLIGDSTVHGGSHLNQPDRLGPQLERTAGRTVWPAGASSWALANELAYIRKYNLNQRVHTIIFVSNSEDFVQPSVWKTEMFHPTHRPLFALGYLIEKGLTRDTTDDPLPEVDSYWQGPLAQFLATFHGRVIFVLHPFKAELAKPFGWTALKAAYPGGQFCDVRPALRPWMYADLVHLKPQGITVEANAINQCIEDRSPGQTDDAAPPAS